MRIGYFIVRGACVTIQKQNSHFIWYHRAQYRDAVSFVFIPRAFIPTSLFQHIILHFRSPHALLHSPSRPLISDMPRVLALVALIITRYVASSNSIDGMVQKAERLLQRSQFDQQAGHDERFALAAGAPDLDTEELGVYGEMPLRGVAELLQHPRVAEVLDGAADGPRFVDFGSGAGRLLLGVAGMRDRWASVAGVEALENLHAVAHAAIENAESSGAISPGIVQSVHAGVLPHETPTSEVLRAADVCFMYSTAFPSDDGLRLPELSASLACVMRDGSVVITTDKFLVGPRFTFEALLPVEGSAGEAIHAFVWRVSGPQADSYDEELHTVLSDWMGEDACAQNPKACEALLAALGDGGDDDDEEE